MENSISQLRNRPRSPHIQPVDGLVVDYNGTGIWSADGIRQRYSELAHDFDVNSPSFLELVTHREGERIWIYSMINSLYPLVRAGDPAATQIGVELIEEDEFFRFGRMLKIDMAQALRQGTLTEEQQQRLRTRIVSMLLEANVPQEFREYKRLLRHVGIGGLWSVLDAQVDRDNPYVMRHYLWLDRNARPKIQI